jgi:hypothetical protein
VTREPGDPEPPSPWPPPKKGLLSDPAAVLIVVLLLFIAGGVVLWVIVPVCACGGAQQVTAAPLRAGSTSSCQTASTGSPPSTTFQVYPVGIHSTTRTVTTAELGLTITQPSNTREGPGAGSTAGPGSCPGANPTVGGAWIAVLVSPSGSSQASYSSADGNWTAIGDWTVPGTLASGWTLQVIDSDALGGAALTLYGTGSSGVSGSATLP